MYKAILSLAVLLLLPGCADPCTDYCEVFVDRSQECGLGGPSGDEVVAECGDEVSQTLTDDACDNAREAVSAMSCDDFSSLVCSGSSADSIYNCGS